MDPVITQEERSTKVRGPTRTQETAWPPVWLAKSSLGAHVESSPETPLAPDVVDDELNAASKELNERHADETFVGIRSDEWGFPLEPGEQLIDPSTLTACPQCGSLQKWWPAVGEPRCQRCDPPTAAWRLLRRAQTIRRRLGIEARQPHVVPIEPHCPKCLAMEFHDVPIHGGHSVRRDCAKCGRFIAFPIWCGDRSPISKTGIQIDPAKTERNSTDACSED